MNREQMVKDVYTCASCGYCRFGCPVYSELGFESATARGRMLLLKGVLENNLSYTPKIVDAVYTCAECGNCTEICPTGINYVEIMQFLRRQFATQEMLPQPQKRLRDIIDRKGNPFAEPKEERGAWLPKGHRIVKKGENLYFVGCSSSYASNRIARSLMMILDKVNFDFTVLGGEEYCCGDPLMRMGEESRARKLMNSNLAKFKELGVTRIFTSCPGCLKTLREHCPDEFEVVHATQLLADLVKEGTIKFEGELKKRIIYHDGCDLGRYSGVYEEPREILQSIPGVELFEFDYCRQEAICCGGPLAAGYPDLSHRIAAQKVREAVEKGIQAIVTACPMCFINLKEGVKIEGASIEVQDIHTLLPRLMKR